jgi:hypothetical protein
MKNSFITSSDHHAHFDCLEEIYKYAKEKEIHFVCGGDIIGDYNFENIVHILGYRMPSEIPSLFLQKELAVDDLGIYSEYKRISKFGVSSDEVISKLSQHQEISEDMKNQISTIFKQVEEMQLDKKVKEIIEKNSSSIQTITSEMRIKLQLLFQIIIDVHAQKLAELIDKYKVKTYFLNGNHEPSQFVNLAKSKLTQTDLLIDLGAETGVSNINGIGVAGVSNVNAIMGHVYEFYLPQELDSLFIHQRARRAVIPVEPNLEKLQDESVLKNLGNDFDWNRLRGDLIKELDVFISHGQVGQGAWRDDKKANLMPTLLVAAKLSSMSKITIDCHLHTSYSMKNSLGVKTIRAVGNKAYVLTKDEVSGELREELVEFDTPYNSRGEIMLDLEETKKIIEENYNKLRE